MATAHDTADELSAQTLRELLSYDPDTGIFRWKVARTNRLKVGAETGCSNRAGYKVIRIGNRLYYAHRLAFLYVHGRWPHNQIDHINGCPDDNRIANLREATQSQNNANHRTRSDSTLGVKGVGISRTGDRFTAWAGSRYVGTFDTVGEAESASAEARRNLYGSFA